MNPTRFSLTCTALCLLTPLAAATAPQEGQDEGERPRPRVQELDPLLQPRAPQNELVELFYDVERRLKSISGLLLDASAGDTSRLDEVGESGIGRLLEEAPSNPSASSGGGIASLLRSSRSEGDQAIEGIDRILEIAAQQGGSCSSPGDGRQMPQQGQTPQGAEKNETPEDPDESQDEPKGDQDSGEPTPSRPANKTPDSETQDPVPVPPSNERWGELPIHLRDIFRAEGGQEMPAQYRDWIDAYYRRLNERSGN